MKGFAVAIALGLAACGPGEEQIANDVQSGPAIELTGRIVDRAKLLDAPSIRALELRLAKLEQATSDQLVVVSVPSLGGRAINDFATSLGNRWGIGRGDVDNGVMILIAPSERQVWISVGTGLEGLLTNQRTQGIVDRMLPDFKRGDVPGGIERGLGEIEKILMTDKRRPQRATEPIRKAA